MICLDEKIKRKLRLSNFKKIFNVTEIIDFEIHSNKEENWKFSSCKIAHCLGQKKQSTSPKSRVGLGWAEGRAGCAEGWFGPGWRSSLTRPKVNLSQKSRRVVLNWRLD